MPIEHQCKEHWCSVGRMSITLVFREKNLLSLVVSCKNAHYIDVQWEECPLDWCSVGRMPTTLVFSGKNVYYIGVPREEPSSIGGQLEECPLHWW